MYAKEFLKQKWKKQMKKGYSYEKKGVKNYGLGLRMMEWETGEKLLYHNGWWHGNYTTYVRGEADTITIIALGNKQNRSIYSAFSLAGLFGNYPVIMEKETKLAENNADSVKIKEDSLMAAIIEIKATDKKEMAQTQMKDKSIKVKSLTDSTKNIKNPKINLDHLDSLRNKLSLIN